MMLIRNGRVMDPASGRDEITDLAVEGGRIAAIGTVPAPHGSGAVIDAGGKVVAPGLVDIHVHFRDPGFPEKEDVFSGAAAAAAGGFTSVICMANTRPPVDGPETLSAVLEKAGRAPVHVYAAAAVTKGLAGKELTDMPLLKRMGAVCFTDDGVPLREEALALSAMEQAVRLGVPLSFHEEDPALIGCSGVNEGKVSRKLGLAGAPNVSEDVMVARDCMLALHTGAPVHIQHISSASSVHLVRLAKRLGAHVTAEAAPHHFSLTENAVETRGAMAKMNPPLRTERDRQAVIEGLRDGTIDAIATDHAPHTAAEKSKPFTEAPSGIIGLETSLALGISNLVRPGKLTLMQLLRKMTDAPARIYHLPAGRIVRGGPADLVLFDPDERWTVAGFASRSSNSPFLGETLFGRVKATVCAGKIVYSDPHQ